MSIRISKGRKGSTIRASGKDAQALFDALCRSIGEPTLSEQRAEQDKKQTDPVAMRAATHHQEPNDGDDA